VTATQGATDQARKVKGVTPNIDVVPVQKRPQRPAPWPFDIYQTAVGKKWVMALTGIGLMGFVFAHMVGNLKMYLGEEEYNAYSESLRTLLHPIFPDHFVLWAMRIGLIVMLLVHLHAALSLTAMNRRARPQKYSNRDYIAVNWANRTMRFSGVWIVIFLAIHLPNLTWGLFPAGVAHSPGHETNVYANVVTTFQVIPLSAFYIVSMIALGFHLFHGAWSIFQSLGINSPRYNSLRKGFAVVFSLAVVIPNISFPIAVLTGVVSLPK